MSASETEARQPATTPTEAVDLSMRLPGLLAFGSAIGWLLISNILYIVSTVQITYPNFLGGYEWFTIGRVQGAAETTFLYGFCINALLGVSLWLLARLSGFPLHKPCLPTLGLKFWNLGVTIAFIGIIIGHGTSVSGMQAPGYATLLMLVAYSFVAAYAMTSVNLGKHKVLYATQWYLVTALLCFGWVFLVAQVALVWSPAPGITQEITAAWARNGLYSIVLLPAALGLAYYFVPKFTQKPISNYGFAKFAFWMFLFCAAWTLTRTLADGPVPAWVPTVGIAFNVVILLPVIVIIVNVLGSLRGNFGAGLKTTHLALVIVGFCAFIEVAIITAVLSHRTFAELFRFTLVDEALYWHSFYAVFAITALGAIHYIVPRACGTREWARSFLTRTGFWCVLVGITVSLFSLYVGGILQGLRVNQGTTPVAEQVEGAATGGVLALSEVLETIQPWILGHAVGLFVLLVGHIAIAMNFYLLVKALLPEAWSRKARLQAS